MKLHESNPYLATEEQRLHMARSTAANCTAIEYDGEISQISEAIVYLESLGLTLGRDFSVGNAVSVATEKLYGALVKERLNAIRAGHIAPSDYNRNNWIYKFNTGWIARAIDASAAIFASSRLER